MPYGLDEHMADDLFDALRPELAHVYDTKIVKAGPLECGIYVGWGKYEHMSILRDRNPHGLYLNVKTMWADFERILHKAAEGIRRRRAPAAADVQTFPCSRTHGRSRVQDGDACFANAASHRTVELAR